MQLTLPLLLKCTTSCETLHIKPTHNLIKLMAVKDWTKPRSYLTQMSHADNLLTTGQWCADTGSIIWHSGQSTTDYDNNCMIQSQLELMQEKPKNSPAFPSTYYFQPQPAKFLTSVPGYNTSNADIRVSTIFCKLNSKIFFLKTADHILRFSRTIKIPTNCTITSMSSQVWFKYVALAVLPRTNWQHGINHSHNEEWDIQGPFRTIYIYISII